MKLDDRDYVDMLRATTARLENALLGFPHENSKGAVVALIERLAEINSQRDANE
jgi:hypothetical protein